MWNCWLIQIVLVAFLKKGDVSSCSHAQLINESRQSMWVEHVLTAQTKWPSGLVVFCGCWNTEYYHFGLLHHYYTF